MIYLDNTATSFPKPDSVIHAVTEYLKNYGVSYGRSGYAPALKASNIVFDCREKLAKLFNISDSSRIAFTMNATYGLNTILHGFLNERDSVITTQMEHNSVMRPLNFLSKKRNIHVIELVVDQ